MVALGFSADRVRNQLVAERWQLRSSVVISTFTGPLNSEHQHWLGVLHAGRSAMIGGLSAASVQGLRHWDREVVVVLVPYTADIGPVPGIRFVRTRRNPAELLDPTRPLPVAKLEPAVLMAVAAERSARVAQGLLAATVQQRLTTVDRLMSWAVRLRPLRRARLIEGTLADISQGAHSASEIDVARMCRQFGLAPPVRQVPRQDSAGRPRYTDCEWETPDGRTVVLEVDGSFHMDVEHWENDIARQRRLSGPSRVIVRCSSRELRDEPFAVFSDLARLGVPRGREYRDAS